MVEKETKRKTTLHLKRKMLMLIITIIVVIAAFLAGMLHGGQEEKAEITADLLGQQLRSASDLVTVEYYYTNMGKFENTLDFYGWKVPFTTKSFIVSYDGIIRAGVDLTKAEIQTTETEITIILPAAEIVSNEIQEDSLQVYDETHNIFNPITIQDYNGFQRDQKEVIEQKAIENGLLTAGQEKAEEIVTELLELLPGTDAYTLTVTSRN